MTGLSISPETIRAELSATLRLSGPLVLSNLLQMGVYATDVIFVARLGQHDLAASSLGVAIVMLITMAIMGLTSAAAPLIAAEVGRRHNSVRDVRRSVRMAMWLGLLLGVMGIALCQGAEAFLRLTGQPTELAARAARFVELLGLSLPPMAMAQVLRIVVSALGRPQYALLVNMLAIVVNALGNWVFIFGHLGLPALGLQGSALASTMTCVLMAGAYSLVIVTDRKLRRFHLFGRFWRIEPQRLRQMLVLGTPIALTIVAEGGLFSGAAFLMGRIGELQLAAHAIALQIAAIAFQIPYGIGQAATIRVGYQYGRGSRSGVARAGWIAIALGTGVNAFASVIMLVWPRLLISAYVDTSDPAQAALVALAIEFLFVAAIFQLADAIQAVAAGALRGVQDTRVPMAIALFGYWVGGYSTAVVLGLYTPLAGLGVWIGLAVGLVIAAILLSIRWVRRERFAVIG